MVFEQIFKASWIEKRPSSAFLLGITYALIGIVSARLVFGSSTGLMSVAFTSILLIPSLNALLQDEENVEIRENKFNLLQLFKDHRDIFEIYIFMFLGIFLVYAFVASVLPNALTLNLFPAQLKVAGITGSAFNYSAFFDLVSNNIVVLLVCLVLSLIYGAGSILFITWNASVWGIIFGYIARESSSMQGQDPFIAFFLILLPSLPHMITEAVSYFSAAIVGGIVSKATLREKIFSKKFYHVLTDALILLVIGVVLVVAAAWIESRLM
ncbi:MAG: stage II sporulation protein M [Candidatus Woesearchaeota archaeon]|nr:stage II sporulation protein M [Candidatus Woesearchaeota archaeon]